MKPQYGSPQTLFLARNTLLGLILLALCLSVGCDLTGGYQQRIEDASGRVGRAQAAPAPQPAPVAPGAGEGNEPAE